MTKGNIENSREAFERAVIARMKESGFLEIEIRVEALVRCGDGYEDEVINAGWHYWKAGIAAASPPVVALPDDATAEEILKSTIDHPSAVVMLKRLPDAKAPALEEAAYNPTCRPTAVRPGSLVNDADILASDPPDVVVKKLDAAYEARSLSVMDKSPRELALEALKAAYASMEGSCSANHRIALNTVDAAIRALSSPDHNADAGKLVELETVMRRYRGTDWPDHYPWAFLNESECQGEPGPRWIVEELCRRSQAAELLAAKDAANKRWRSEYERAQSHNVELAEQLAKAEAEAERWHKKAMDAGVIVHSDGTTSHPMRKERDDLKADNERKDYLLSASDTVAQQLQNQIVTLTFQKEDLEAQLERFRSDRAYTVGFTDGYAASEAKLAAAIPPSGEGA